MNQHDEMVKAFCTLDHQTIDAYLRKYNIPIESHETRYWTKVYKVIASEDVFPDELRAWANGWLRAHNKTKRIYRRKSGGLF